MSSLSWRHHTLIQAMLSRGPLKEKEFHSIFSAVTGKNPVTHQQLLKDYLLKINKELSFVQFELRACRNQYDGSVYYGVVNNVSDEQSKLGTKYTVPQIIFYKGVIEAIAEDTSAKGSISNIDALNIRLDNQISVGAGSQSQDAPAAVPYAIKNFSMSQKEKTLEELVQDQWLCSFPDGDIGLGPRSFLDLRSWFRGNDVPACEVCNETGLKADLCQNERCPVRMHTYCVKKKFSSNRVEKVCPGCSAPWPYQVCKAEVVEEDEEYVNQPSQTQLPPQASAGKKRRRSSRTADSGNNHGPSLTQETASTSNPRRSTRSSAQLR